MNPCSKCVDYDMAACEWCKRNEYKAFRGMETLTQSTPVVTNYDRIISKTPEELAAWFIKIQDDTADYIDGQYSRNLPATSESWALWLKSPVEPGEGNDGKTN